MYELNGSLSFISPCPAAAAGSFQLLKRKGPGGGGRVPRPPVGGAFVSHVERLAKCKLN